MSELARAVERRMPDLVGARLEQALAALAGAGLPAPEVLFRTSTAPRDQVLAQEPAAHQPLAGAGTVTLWVARRGYLELLPVVLRRSPADGEHLVRALCFVLEHLLGSIEDQLDGGERRYQPRECPADFLPWLAGWVGLALDDDLPEPRQRAVVAGAVAQYRLRGTARGLVQAIERVTGLVPVVEEGRRPGDGMRVGCAPVGLAARLLATEGPGHAVTVRLPVRADQATPEWVARVHRLIARATPAHVECWLQLEEAAAVAPSSGLAIGLRSGIGIGDEHEPPRGGDEEHDNGE